MAKVFVSFALADSMVPLTCTAARKPLTVEEVKALLAGEFTSACNSGHTATLSALRERFGIDVPAPERPPNVTLGVGDRLVVLSVRNLPRLTEPRNYTPEEVASAAFAFGVWTVLE